MKIRNLNLLLLCSLTVGVCTFAGVPKALADCEVVSNGKRTPYNGNDLQSQNLAVEKKSLLKLDRQYPNLNVVEKTFKGEVTICSNCTDNFLVCSN